MELRHKSKKPSPGETGRVALEILYGGAGAAWQEAIALKMLCPQSFTPFEDFPHLRLVLPMVDLICEVRIHA
jgi:hypothetical protein